MYEGQWRAGEKHGQGKFSFATGDVYEGEYAKDKKHGKGTYTYAGGDVYEGEYAEGKKHGQGKYTSATGNVYEGEYAKDKKHGKGTYTYAGGEVEVGCYEAGADVGQGVRWSADRATAWEVQAGKVSRTIPRWTRRPRSPSGSGCCRPEAVHPTVITWRETTCVYCGCAGCSVQVIDTPTPHFGLWAAGSTLPLTRRGTVIPRRPARPPTIAGGERCERCP